MDEADRARDAARDALADVTPDRLRERLYDRLVDAPVAPGVLTLLAARATGRDGPHAGLDRRAAGVQLIYDGLQLTRRLARDPPWEREADSTDADIDVLAAEVLVARGFYLLASTEAADQAVETVRHFGRDETNREMGRPDRTLADRTLEADVFELAIVAGVSAVGAAPPADAREFAVDLAASFDDGLPAAPALLSEPAVEALENLVADRTRAPAPERIWAGSGATDP
ncbi:MAG: hypothetical protein U5J98_01775 [Halobacteriales archaeon]|nr:hypothetical protein [Halobacteriales archaeon]